MRPINIDNTNTEICQDNFISNISDKELVKIIDQNISIKNRPVFLKLLGGVKVPRISVNKLIKEIQQILKDHDINEST